MKAHKVDTKVHSIINEVCQIMQIVFNEKFIKVILYGSYARDEQDLYSDMDIMVLVDMDETELREYDNQDFDLTYSLTQKYGILLSVLTKSETHFMHWVNVLPFYAIIRNEGIEFHAS